MPKHCKKFNIWFILISGVSIIAVIVILIAILPRNDIKADDFKNDTIPADVESEHPKYTETLSIDTTFSTEPTETQITATPLPTPTPHPGDRDNKFTDGEVIIDEMNYYSHDLSIEITKHQTELVTYFVAEVYYRNNENYFSAFSYGADDDRIQRTSDILADSGGIFAVSGDYYNARDYGLIIRNGIIYRTHSSTEIMAVFDDGSMKTYERKGETADNLLALGALHTYSFGPALLEDGKPIDDFEGRTKEYLRKEQPRCAAGMIEPYHYVFVVVDGRSEGYSEGMRIEDLSKLMYELGCTQAYNLDGGGSATMVFMGKLVNLPLGYPGERKVADAVVFKEIN